MGDEVYAEAGPIKIDRNLAYLKCELRHKMDDSIIARGIQTMLIGGSSINITDKLNLIINKK